MRIRNTGFKCQIRSHKKPLKEILWAYDATYSERYCMLHCRSSLFDGDLDSAYHFDTDPDPSFYSDADLDPDPDFLIKAQKLHAALPILSL